MATNFSRFVANWYRGCEVIATRFDSIDSLRIELCKAESFHRKSIFLVNKYGGCEVTAIRVDSIDSLRIEPCKAESFHRKSIFLVYKYGGCEVMRFDSIRSIRCESNLVSRIALPEVVIPGIQVWGVWSYCDSSRFDRFVANRSLQIRFVSAEVDLYACIGGLSLCDLCRFAVCCVLTLVTRASF